jgi:hypothetical protein
MPRPRSLATIHRQTGSRPQRSRKKHASLSDAVRHEIEQSSLPFTEEDVRLITAFVGSALRDERNQAAFPAEVPSGLPLPIDLFGAR